MCVSLPMDLDLAVTVYLYIYWLDYDVEYTQPLTSTIIYSIWAKTGCFRKKIIVITIYNQYQANLILLSCNNPLL